MISPELMRKFIEEHRVGKITSTPTTNEIAVKFQAALAAKPRGRGRPPVEPGFGNWLKRQLSDKSLQAEKKLTNSQMFHTLVAQFEAVGDWTLAVTRTAAVFGISREGARKKIERIAGKGNARRLVEQWIAARRVFEPTLAVLAQLTDAERDRVPDDLRIADLPKYVKSIVQARAKP